MVTRIVRGPACRVSTDSSFALTLGVSPLPVALLGRLIGIGSQTSLARYGCFIGKVVTSALSFASLTGTRRASGQTREKPASTRRSRVMARVDRDNVRVNARPVTVVATTECGCQWENVGTAVQDLLDLERHVGQLAATFDLKDHRIIRLHSIPAP